MHAQDHTPVDSFMRATDSLLTAMAKHGQVSEVKTKGKRIHSVSITQIDGVVYEIERKVKFRKGVRFEEIKVFKRYPLNTDLRILEVLLVNGSYEYIEKNHYDKVVHGKKVGKEAASQDHYVRWSRDSPRFSFWSFTRK